ncbi:MAG: IS3 family transposase [Treponema sp.]|nr:IS3 family transposase [Candidatus Treponema equifaecale]
MKLSEAVVPFISYYNNERPKSELGGLPPVQFRLNLLQFIFPPYKISDFSANFTKK